VVALKGLPHRIDHRRIKEGLISLDVDDHRGRIGGTDCGPAVVCGQGP